MAKCYNLAVNIYYQPHANHTKEMGFVEHLVETFPQARIIPHNFPIDANYLNCFVQKDELIAKLQADNLLPNQRRQNCLHFLADCPPQIKIATNPNFVSFDVVIELDEQIYYWEFHEQQHRNLAVGRLSPVYNAENNDVIHVPRYLQRLIRDVWRAKYFRPYSIVWFDWFAQNQHEYKPKLQEGLHEFYLPDQFSFRDFLYGNNEGED